jgi:hypothetical protein
MSAIVGDDLERLSALPSTYSSAHQNALLISLLSTIYSSPLIERQDKLTMLGSAELVDEMAGSWMSWWQGG